MPQTKCRGLPADSASPVLCKRMAEYIAPIQRLVDEFRRIPGVGAKTAARYAFAILNLSDVDAARFAEAVIGVKRDVCRCPICHGLASVESGCEICSSPDRDRSLICVVEEPKDVMTMERIRGFRGVYHVLGGVISPRAGISPNDISIPQLIERVARDGAEEVIIATNATVEGETTALYISRLLKSTSVRTTRLAYGIPVGGDLEYADKLTLLRAIEGRRDF